MPSSSDIPFMQRAIQLAMKGRGRVEPNPMVGCVIVLNNQIIGEGFHQHFGGPHAEPSALAACTQSPRGATAYVTLEPCCHTNKKTPPCAPRLIEAGLARVVIGCADPNPLVNGQGIAQLRAAAVQVTAPLLENACRQLLAPFIAQMQLGRPYITLKWAQTADARVAGPGGQRLQISNQHSMRLVQQLRANSDAILVGINTVLADDPMLIARDIAPSRLRHRVVLDRTLRIPLESQLVRTAPQLNVIVICEHAAFHQQSARRSALQYAGVKVLGAGASLRDALTQLFLLPELAGATHLLVEPGPTLARSFFEQQLADRVWLFRAPLPLNEPSAPVAAPLPSQFIQSGHLQLAGDLLTEHLNTASPVYFQPDASADLLALHL